MRLTNAIAAFLILPAALAGPAAAQDGLVWSYDRQLDRDPFKTRLTLMHAIPETDAVQLIAECQIGAGGTYAVVRIGADIGDLSEGATVNVTFVGPNFQHVLTGDVVGVNAEVGITGASLPVELDDPLWRAMQSLSGLSYSARLFTDQQLGLNGASGPVGQFVADCRDMPSPDDVGGPPGNTASLSCDNFGSLRTVDTGPAASVTFVNRTDGYRSVMWIDATGMPQAYGNLNPGESYVQETFVGHPWMITDGPGNCLEMFMPAAGASVFDITAPNQDFGPE